MGKGRVPPPADLFSVCEGNGVVVGRRGRRRGGPGGCGDRCLVCMREAGVDLGRGLLHRRQRGEQNRQADERGRKNRGGPGQKVRCAARAHESAWAAAGSEAAPFGTLHQDHTDKGCRDQRVHDKKKGKHRIGPLAERRKRGNLGCALAARTDETNGVGPILTVRPLSFLNGVVAHPKVKCKSEMDEVDARYT